MVLKNLSTLRKARDHRMNTMKKLTGKRNPVAEPKTKTTAEEADARGRGRDGEDEMGNEHYIGLQRVNLKCCTLIEETVSLGAEGMSLDLEMGMAMKRVNVEPYTRATEETVSLGRGESRAQKRRMRAKRVKTYSQTAISLGREIIAGEKTTQVKRVKTGAEDTMSLGRAEREAGKRVKTCNQKAADTVSLGRGENRARKTGMIMQRVNVNPRTATAGEIGTKSDGEMEMKVHKITVETCDVIEVENVPLGRDAKDSTPTPAQEITESCTDKIASPQQKHAKDRTPIFIRKIAVEQAPDGEMGQDEDPPTSVQRVKVDTCIVMENKNATEDWEEAKEEGEDVSKEKSSLAD